MRNISIFGIVTFVLLLFHGQQADCQITFSPTLYADSNSGSLGTGVSANGRFVVFSSSATNLVPDTNNQNDIFLYDRRFLTMKRVSLTNSGGEANGKSTFPDIADDGNSIVFQSNSDNIRPADPNTLYDVYLRDAVNNKTVLISKADDGTVGDDESYGPVISGDGRFVAFTSAAKNLVPLLLNLAYTHVYVHDRDPDQDGIFDEANATVSLVSLQSISIEGWADSFSPAISEDGSQIAFASDSFNFLIDNNNATDIFVRKVKNKNLVRVSISSTGEEANGASFYPQISGDGRFVGFWSDATNLVANDNNGKRDVFLHDRDPDGDGILDQGNGITVRVSEDINGNGGNGDSWKKLDIAKDGRYVIYYSEASNLVSGDNNTKGDVFLYDRLNRTNKLISIDNNRVQGNGISDTPAISTDGSTMIFASAASNLVAGDNNVAQDIFIHGDELTLAATPSIVAPGESLRFDMFQGIPGQPLIFFLTQVNGNPFTLPLFVINFDSIGGQTLQVSTGAGWSGFNATFQVFAIGSVSGMVQASNSTVITFQ